MPKQENADPQKAVRDTLNTLSWKIKQETPEAIIASTRLGLRSWGERLHIRLNTDGSLYCDGKHHGFQSHDEYSRRRPAFSGQIPACAGMTG